ncbi:AsmA-like protein [Humitalea rosea]|uniref:AsmA-like protein n=1 Tax=Humitalea rosea TaxID=990373 RepID=A0A2W7I891_9PROT|nr:AsmA family protein [Humitalea rosea]PZW43151.1 AsmA-like protein [Humitalea rosea]
MTLKRIALLLLGLPAVLLLALVVWAAVFFDADALRPRVAAEAERATGRALTIAGPLRIVLWPRPSVSAEGLALANLPGGSRPEMLTIRRAEAEVALWPLLRGKVELARLRLVGADLLLENQNWVFSPAARPPGRDTAPSPAAARSGSFAVGEVVLEDARIAMDGQTATIPRLVLRDAAGGVTLAGQIETHGLALEANAQGGRLAPLLAGLPEPWPLKAEVTGPGLAAGFEGSLSKGLTGVARLRLDRLSRLAPLRPGLPEAEGVEAELRLAGSAPGALRLSVAGLPIGPARAEQLVLAADGLAAPLGGTGQLRMGAGVLQARFTGGPLARFLPGAAPDTWPMRLEAEGEGLTLAASGALPKSGGLPAVEVALRAADLGAAGQRFGLPLPALHAMTLHGISTPLPDGRLQLSQFALASTEGDVAGDGVLTLGVVPRVAAQLTSRRLDVAAMTLAVARAPAPAPAPGPASPPVPPPLPARSNRVIPDLPLPVGRLKDLLLAADVTWKAGEVLSQGETYRDIDLHLVLGGGKLLLEPFDLTLPAGRAALRVEADATATPPRLGVRLRSDRLDSAALADALGMARRLAGPLEVDLDLAGPGEDLRRFLAGGSGHVGLAMVGGRLERSALAGLPPELVSLLLPGGMPAEGVALRCTALRLRVGEGAARIETLLIDGDLGQLGGGGGIGLADESLNLRLLPDVHIGQVNLRAPFTIVGTLSVPRLGQVDSAGAAGGALGALLSLQRTPDRRLTELAQGLSGGGPALPECAPALMAARGGREGPAPGPRPARPSAAPAAGTPADPLPASPQDLLRGLFGR